MAASGDQELARSWCCKAARTNCASFPASSSCTGARRFPGASAVSLGKDARRKSAGRPDPHGAPRPNLAARHRSGPARLRRESPPARSARSGRGSTCGSRPAASTSACVRSAATTRFVTRLPGCELGGELRTDLGVRHRDQLRHDHRRGEDRHEVGVSLPARDDVFVEMVGDTCAGRRPDVESEIEPIGRITRGEARAAPVPAARPSRASPRGPRPPERQRARSVRSSSARCCTGRGS